MILTGKFHLIVHLIQQVDQKVYAYLTIHEAHGLTRELPEKFSILQIKNIEGLSVLQRENIIDSINYEIIVFYPFYLVTSLTLKHLRKYDLQHTIRLFLLLPSSWIKLHMILKMIYTNVLSKYFEHLWKMENRERFEIYFTSYLPSIQLLLLVHPYDDQSSIFLF